MVSATQKGVKVVLKLAEGSQSISNCNKSATDEQLYKLASAVGKLEKEAVESVTKVVESVLINE